MDRTLSEQQGSILNGLIAFRVEEIAPARQAVEQAGGREFGEVTTIPGAPTTWCYVTDPEDNLIERLQPVSK